MWQRSVPGQERLNMALRIIRYRSFSPKKNISRVEKQLRSMTRQRQWMLRTLQLCEPCSLPTVDSPAATPTLRRSRSCFMQLYCHERTLGLKDTPLPGLVGSFLVPPVHGALARAASCSLSARICRKWETGRVSAVSVTRSSATQLRCVLL